MKLASKLRALEYLIAAIDEGGFTGAARKLGVSPPAVHKMIGALEATVAVTLLHRDGGRLKLTSEGEIYVAGARAALRELTQAESQIAFGRSRPAGQVRLALSHVLGSHCIGHRLHEFHQRHQDVSLDLVAVTDDTDLDTLAADVLVYLGWTSQQDCITRRLAQTRLLVVAAPSYWERHGMPARPRDLLGHQCITLRLLKRAIMDHWAFERDGVRESVPVSGWIVSDDRDWTFEAVRAGSGLTRVPDIVAHRYLASGELVPALLDWQVAEAPPVVVSYRRDMKDVPRVRVLVQFLMEIFRELDAQRLPAPAAPLRAEPMPPWVARRHLGRTSARRPAR
ncbi:LysR family transcriptional regulator [Pigmentiphaga soli]|uniref:LysR family transcriptional regulator n=1 Tax=Pigmentiphaga soli TaxID=1007095 RepID=A0ABP8GSZ3_9BURK